MNDLSQSSFSMRGARNAISQGLSHIEAQVQSIEEAVSNQPGLAFDLAKTIVESVCRTILADKGIKFKETDELPRLFSQVNENLRLLPPPESQASAVRRSIKRTLGGLFNTIQGIAELRNQLGFASHGTDRARPAMETSHAVLAAQAADTIVGFLYFMHTQSQHKQTEIEHSPIQDSDFDQFVDSNFESVQIFDSQFLPSEILFQMEPNSYRIYLSDFLKEEPESGEGA